MILSLIRISALLPGVSEKADEQKAKAKAEVYEKEYVRGSILDRNGNPIAWSEEPGGKRHYASSTADSSLIGYWSKRYGTSGVENTMNAVLTYSASDKKNKRGADVTLTIDQELQELAYEQIADFTGSAVVLDVKSGEILAMASSPTFSEETLEDDWKKLGETEGVLLSNAFQNPVAPGSVFKVITSKGILENHLEEQTVEDEGSLRVNGQTIRNYNGTAYGTLDWEKGFVKSSNVYFMSMALEMGGKKLQRLGEDFLLGEEIELDFTTLRSTWDLEDYEENMIASTAFGQGNTEITPLHMAMITQSIANDGQMNRPYLIQSVVNGKGKTIEEGKAETLKQTMEAETARRIQEAMTEAGNSYGLSGDGYEIAAKTGTAQRGDGTNNAWMITFAPAENPQYVIVVNRLKTKEIGKSLSPVVERLYSRLLDHE